MFVNYAFGGFIHGYRVKDDVIWKSMINAIYEHDNLYRSKESGKLKDSDRCQNRQKGQLIDQNKMPPIDQSSSIKCFTGTYLFDLNTPQK